MGVGLWLLVACGAAGTEEHASASSGDEGRVLRPRVPGLAPRGPGIPDPVATVVRACPDGTGDAATLAEAIARAGPGGTVVACGGDWREPLRVEGTRVVLRGEPGTRLTGGDGAPVAEVRDGGALTLVGVSVLGVVAPRGGGILCEDGQLVLRDVEVRGGRAEVGGGVAAAHCDVRIVDSRFVDDHATQDGGGLFLLESRVRLSGVSIEDSGAHRGGGLAIVGGDAWVQDGQFLRNQASRFGGGAWTTGDPVVSGNVFSDNRSVWQGGGLYLEGGAAQVSDNLFTRNATTEDGAGLVSWSGAPRIVRNRFVANEAEDDAGGMRLFESHATVRGNVFRDNRARSGDGGAVKVSHAASVFEANRYEANAAGGRGGAMEIDDDSSRLRDEVFVGNRADGDGGGLHTNIPNWDVTLDGLRFDANESQGCGGALAVGPSPFRVRVDGLRARGNAAARGGAVCVRGETRADAGLSLVHGVLAENTARDGGGVWVGGARAELRNGTLVGNVASTGAGCLANGAGAALDVHNTIVSGHAGAALDTRGGGSIALRYALLWNGDGDSTAAPGVVLQDGTLSADPAFLDAAAGDYALTPMSPARDAGDPAVLDPDGSRSDIGATGG
jgi:hypothetical protein